MGAARVEATERGRSLPGTRKAQARPAKANEERQAAQAGLDLLRVLGWLVLHDVAVRGRPDAAADHVVVGPSGVYVVNNAPWTGAVAFRDGRLIAGGAPRTDEVDQIAGVADAVRALLGGSPVAGVLCLVHAEPLTGVAGEVAVCSTENILDLLTQLPALFDAATQQHVARVVGAALVSSTPRAVTAAPVVVPVVVPAKHRSKPRLLRRRTAEEPEASVVEAPVVKPPVIKPPVAKVPVVETPVAKVPVVELPRPIRAPAAPTAAERSRLLDPEPAEPAVDRAEQDRVEQDRVEQDRVENEQRAQQRAEVEAERARVAEEREQVAAEQRQVRDEHERAEAERRKTAEERERVAAERTRVAEDRRQAERAQAEAVAERKRAIEERRHADEARARAESEARRATRERVAADKAAAKRVAADRAAAARIEAARQAEAVPAPVAAPVEVSRELPRELPSAVRKPAPVPAAELKRPRRLSGSRSLVLALISAVVVVLVVSVVPRVPELVTWGKGLFAGDPAPAFGTAVAVDATTFHPALLLTAAAPATTKPTRGAVASGTHLVAVTLTLRNDGISAWSMPVTGHVVAVDSLGVEHRPARVAAVSAGRLLPATVALASQRQAAGVVAFSVPNGRDVTGFRVEFSDDSGDAVSWATP